MTIEDIIYEKQLLDLELRQAVSTMDKKNTIQTIRARQKALQEQCPHDGSPDVCAYCGKRFK